MADARADRPGLLIIFDGLAWGEAGHPCNAVERAATPTFDRLRATCPATELTNNGPAVGLPEGQMGNSEVGHMNIGAGRVVLQDFMRINEDIRTSAYAGNAALVGAFEHVLGTGGALHLMGLLGPGGVHAHETHFGAALDAAARAGVERVYVHAIGDGRDTPPRSAQGYMQTLMDQIDAAGVGEIASYVGRYYAMDRDERWDRIQAAYDLYARGEAARHVNDPLAAIQAGYDRDEDDEFTKATKVGPDGVIAAGDAVVWMNFRPDRSRQMTRAFMAPDAGPIDRGDTWPDGARSWADRRLQWVCSTQYDAEFRGWPGLRVAYPPVKVPMTLAEHVASLGLRQFHAAETEKYAHVTYFLNGGIEEPWPGEEREMVPSPKVATYDLAPEMSAGPLTDAVLAALGSGNHDLVIVNYANPDMVGHTGVLDATVKAVEFVDNQLHRVLTVAEEMGFVTLITSDHGNAEDMCDLDAAGRPATPRTKHSMFPSPLIAVNAGEIALRAGGALENVAPTLLDLMGVPTPKEMTADSLVERA